ncbi:hypothetical protein [Streptomyces lomondensis]|uniref:Uncharacterized protein n=1 Tax=Streptomyces lomondensis TaxID=68229 RepID=A0ABQ2X2M0_9ACTN|nr:hypothetical protein [Streptomyces lomondensis]MCF0083247.1 hypothetical protein [Streptomyces lomondensis]GGW95126.1 hypothetical protein GCM10010383_25880 [Streptomyces lomondensis]
MMRQGTRWLASHVGRWQLLRPLVLVVLAMVMGLFVGWAGLPEWTLGIGILLLLLLDDVLKAYGKLRAARRDEQKDFSVSPVDD